MKNKVWFITGASKGFGFEIAKAVLASGDQVVATVRKDAKQLADKLGFAEQLLVVTLDVTNEPDVQTGVKAAIDRFGRIDVLVNNAGYGLLAATEEATADEVRKQYDTNVFGLLNVTRSVLPQLRKQASGHIINISSLFAYLNDLPGLGLYGSTKYAVEGISEGLSVELKPFGIHVTSVAPGLFSTDFASANSYQTSSKIIDDYRETVGVMRARMANFHGSQPGDPSKLAAVILTLVASNNPPLHLPIGADAVERFRQKALLIGREVEAWESISKSTDHQPA
ncbi:oxidoreductase [Paraflavitalea sp. CAU 1676]|uniref:oxidoreductase n=1 Tax=Paraflavitalea sp. CAU 1676 TaxID=3032598 RepID=UPI0023DA5484|nr:oxidoreductase [Paraflavitalea sp. CAU 1676]MDF2189152.1 oxidoreductase [Paraflavitalea sp. CAU 1676]